MDENGNYGYIKAGADSVTPFKNSSCTYIGNTVSSLSSNTFDATSIPNYKNLKNNNFVIEIVFLYAGIFGATHNNYIPQKSYDANTGILTVSPFYSSTSRSGDGGYCEYKILVKY